MAKKDFTFIFLYSTIKFHYIFNTVSGTIRKTIQKSGTTNIQNQLSQFFSIFVLTFIFQNKTNL